MTLESAGEQAERHTIGGVRKGVKGGTDSGNAGNQGN